MRNLITNVVPEHLLRQAQLRALKVYSDVIECTYGPMGGFTAYSKTNIDNKSMAVSYYSKDGLTNLKNVEVDQPIEALLKDELIDICSNVVKVIGDGTSTAVLLAYQIFKGMLDLNKKGYRKRIIIESFKELIEEMTDKIKERGRDATLYDIYNIAYTSTNGNSEMANIISSIYKDYGMDAWISVQASSGPETVIKGYDGMFYDSGYLDPCFINNEITHTCDLYNPHIFVFESPIDTPEMIKIFSLIIQKEINDPLVKIQQANQSGKSLPEGFSIPDLLIICPFISRDANAYLDKLISSFTQTSIENRFHFCIVSEMGDDPSQLIDIAKMTGARFIKKYIDPEQYKIDQKAGLAPNIKNIHLFAGTSEKVIIDSVSTRIINPAKMREDGKLTNYFINYIDELKDILAKKEETREDIVNIERLRRRINNLLGNMVDLYIGGIGTSDRRSLSDSVEDAVLNCRSAAQDGVGYGASFEGLIAANEILREYEELAKESSEDNIFMKVKSLMAGVIMGSYINIVTKLYQGYYEDHQETIKQILESISTKENQDRGPFNIITEKYDGHVLTSIKTEIAILESLSRIISIIFDTNQFLVPTPQFNCYTEKETTLQIINRDGQTTSSEIEEELSQEFQQMAEKLEEEDIKEDEIQEEENSEEEIVKEEELKEENKDI